MVSGTANGVYPFDAPASRPCSSAMRATRRESHHHHHHRSGTYPSACGRSSQDDHRETRPVDRSLARARLVDGGLKHRPIAEHVTRDGVGCEGHGISKLLALLSGTSTGQMFFSLTRVQYNVAPGIIATEFLSEVDPSSLLLSYVDALAIDERTGNMLSIAMHSTHAKNKSWLTEKTGRIPKI
eukprot:6188585-Pleurochrysis_carterae.AAC.2